ncbi:MAG: PDZ domain-containing protein [Deltaproteobacteria bacterium]|nr:PDZ domain-containing protein [Deltaproteobacteria bacterium]
MRSAWVLTALLATTAVASAKPSNPAFLGISMPGGNGPCFVEGVTRGSAAKLAGMLKGDVMHSIDGTPTPNCDAVLRAIQGHEPGDQVKIAIARAGRPMVLNVELLSRAEIMRRRLVGQPMLATDLFGVDDQRSLDLSSLRGKTAIVGWFDARRCDGCTQVFGKVASWTRAQTDKPGFPPMPLAVTPGQPHEAKALMPMGLDVPLAIAEREVYEDLVVADADRINFMVIDCRGIVRYVAPISPSADDADAAIDELFAAAEQASRRTTK